MSQLDELPGRTDDYRSALLLAPLDSSAEDRACFDLLTQTAPAETNVLSVTFSATPLERVALWKRLVGEERPKRGAILGPEREVSEQRATAQTDSGMLIKESLSDPADPFELLLLIGRHLGRWTGTDEQTLVCLRSVTALLDSMESSQVMHLLSVLSTRFEEAEVVAHYHLDPDAHDQQMIADLRPLFDSVVEFNEELGWTVSRTEHRQSLDHGHGSQRKPGAHSGATESIQLDGPVVPNSFDLVIDILSSLGRRAVLYYLAFECDSDPTITLETLVEELRRLAGRVSEDSWYTSEQAFRVSLVHVHLPRLAEAGIVEFDLDAKTIQYQPNHALEDVIKQIMHMEDVG